MTPYVTLFELGASLDRKSYDPYDLLLSPFTTRLPHRLPLVSRLLLQLGRRSGTGLRRVMRVPPHEEPKALADFLRAAAQLDCAKESWAGAHGDVLSGRLIEAAFKTSRGCGWGVRFPWVSRFGAMAAGEPNTYTTTVACQALLDHHQVTGRETSLYTARGGARFILDELGSFEHGGRRWLCYTAGSTSPIVNIQASAASLFARVHRVRPVERLLEAADRAAGVAVAAQRPDGSWPYSDDERGSFVDGFHTGFTLQGLAEYIVFRGDESVRGATEAVESGFAYFKRHLLTPDGRSRGYADRRESHDGQTIAQAIQTLVSCGGIDDVAVGVRIWRSSRDSKHLERPFPALRWSLGPFAVASASLVRVLDSRSDGVKV